jgi:hypothetical protein
MAAAADLPTLLEKVCNVRGFYSRFIGLILWALQATAQAAMLKRQSIINSMYSKHTSVMGSYVPPQ